MTEPTPWRWLESTRELQRMAYGNTFPYNGEELADWVIVNHTACVKELGEALDEVGWKTWAHPRGWVNREAFLRELIDAGHFLANLAIAVNCTDEEWERLYREKQAVNLKRQQDGYDGVSGKCPQCHKAYDDPSTRCLREMPHMSAWCESIQRYLPRRT